MQRSTIHFYYQSFTRSRYAEELATELANSMARELPKRSVFEVFIRDTGLNDAKRFAVVVNLNIDNEMVFTSSQTSNIGNEFYTTLRRGLYNAFAEVRRQWIGFRRKQGRRAYLARKISALPLQEARSHQSTSRSS